MFSGIKRTVFGIGFNTGDIYPASVKGKHTKCYDMWHDMMKRCYSEKYQKGHKYGENYVGCTVCEEWHNFQVFAKWYYENYYEVENERMCLDKDIVCRGNKTYCPQHCRIVPNMINCVINNCKSARNGLPVGIHKQDTYYIVQCSAFGKQHYLGCFGSKQEAFRCYKQHKESVIKQTANKYKEYIPQDVYTALLNWEVNITD